VRIELRSKWTAPIFRLAPFSPAELRQAEVWLGVAKVLVVDEQARSWEREHGADARRKLRASVPPDADLTMSPDMGVAAPDGVGTSTFTSVVESDTPRAGRDIVARLEQLETLHQRGLVTDDEYQTRRRRILDEL
jgi:hypothetical protein